MFVKWSKVGGASEVWASSQKEPRSIKAKRMGTGYRGRFLWSRMRHFILLLAALAISQSHVVTR